MEEQGKMKVNMTAYRRWNIEHQMEMLMLEKTHSLNVRFYDSRKEMFHRKMKHIQEDVEHIQSSNCLTQMKKHIHLLKFAPRTDRSILSHRQASAMECVKKQQQRHRLPSSDRIRREKSFLDEQILNEAKMNERKVLLLKQLGELKHTIDDPHSTYSALAALSRAFVYFESKIDG